MFSVPGVLVEHEHWTLVPVTAAFLSDVLQSYSAMFTETATIH